MSNTALVLKRFPYLRDYIPIFCRCGKPLEIRGEYLDERLNGIETEPCASCGAGSVQVTTYIDPKEMAEMALILSDAASGGGEGSDG